MVGKQTIVIPGILNAQVYITEVLGPVVIPFLNQNPGIMIFVAMETIRIKCQFLFYWKIEKKYFKMSSVENFTQSAKH